MVETNRYFRAMNVNKQGHDLFNLVDKGTTLYSKTLNRRIGFYEIMVPPWCGCVKFNGQHYLSEQVWRDLNKSKLWNCCINFTADKWHSMNFITMRKQDHKVLKKRSQKHYRTMPNGIFYAHFLSKSKSRCTFLAFHLTVMNGDPQLVMSGLINDRLNKWMWQINPR